MSNTVDNDFFVPENVLEISENIVSILEYIKSNNLKNNDDLPDIIEKQFPEFCNKYYGIFNILINKKTIDIDNLILMLSTLDKIHKKEITLDTGINDLRNTLNDKYISNIVNKK